MLNVGKYILPKYSLRRALKRAGYDVFADRLPLSVLPPIWLTNWEVRENEYDIVKIATYSGIYRPKFRIHSFVDAQTKEKLMQIAGEFCKSVEIGD
ncbi:MAG: hypothetical protein HY514_00295 [Candidatus Aenigmarchaeota archaeon]|nr:hypothetical protein [Candidatus Aenigmarchaeota archaeon]